MEKVNWSSIHVICILVGKVIWTSTSVMSSFPFIVSTCSSNFKFEWCYFDCVHCDFKFIWRDFDMDSLFFELQIVFYFQLFLSANVRHINIFYLRDHVQLHILVWTTLNLVQSWSYHVKINFATTPIDRDTYVDFRKISVRKTIWDLEFSEHLL